MRSQYCAVRALSEALCHDLSPEDALLQAMPDVSPAKWHLAHTTWFFETFLLEPNLPGYSPSHPAYRVLFNSYYESVGPQFARPQRGVLSRPSLAEVMAYRAHVDAQMVRWLASLSSDDPRLDIVALGLNHEQQHQELLATDIKYNLSVNPLQPAWRPFPDSPPPLPPGSPREPQWAAFSGGLVEVGHAGGGFAFDNEGPRHRAFLEPYRLRTTPSTNAEYLAFIEDGGYQRPQLWLSEGWAWVQAQGSSAPLYWRQEAGGRWTTFTLHGRLDLDLHAPVTHISGYEAEAFAAWSGARLPTEVEWEAAAAAQAIPEDANLLGRFPALHPQPASSPSSEEYRLAQVYGDVWEWTRSAYLPYPGYRPAAGALGEYNGKFMCGQWVLRGGSCATPIGHIRPSYRNFFYPHQRWQFTGVRLADSTGSR